MSHTPGPWRYQREITTGYGERPVSRFEVYRLAGPYGHPATCELEANARLIVAAPDMLEALQSFVRQVDEFEAGKWDEVDWPAVLAGLKGIRQTARAAIAKAEGGGK